MLQAQRVGRACTNARQQQPVARPAMLAGRAHLTSPALRSRPAPGTATFTQPKQQPKPVVHTQAAAGAGASATPAPQSSGGNSTFTQAVFNVVNVMMGVGVLSLPFALKSSGWVGLLVLWVMGVATNYTAKALCECADAVSAKTGGGPVGYEEIAEAAFGPLGRLLVSAIIYVELFGTCALLFILEGDNMFKLFGASSLASNASTYQLLAAALMIPTVWLPDLKALSFLGAAGVTATCTVSAAVAYTFLSGSFAPGAPTDLANWATLPLVLGICTFCYSGHGVFPAIQKSMADPKQFPQVLNVAYLAVAVICTLMGAAGYYMYGTGALDLVTFNMVGPLAAVCASVILINPVAKFALTMEPPAAALQGVIPGAKKGIMRLLTRTALAIGILLAARSVPFLGQVMALVGSFLTISVSVTFPPLCHQVLCGHNNSALRSAWNYFIAALGLICTFCGTTASMKSLAAKAAATAAGAPA
ncbi:hypothetical protein CHLRE_03g168550v5 [Chlamydomonas reinhardtii]|uniref:Amino acid transporter transmembrane domain-containing protein n=1 Tax=Chlamydomonas reinhardtii TaxID=3055 RepID=A8IF06_CHLRE|nr:uncharacterized protein CHLRE_03g168550v5 [Chlamydomonas reinhardtii]PNW85026.1 hypothetical protein CHLRE_03g168550v5 [Chlamydomonas reinhardtii]|eukprot:XP_001703505.1 amino acid permease [Chlamydomonas reinhardtii]